MPISSSILSVGSNPLALASNLSASWVEVQNLGGAGGFLYLGGPAVSSNTGYALASNEHRAVPTGGGPLYGVSSGGKVEVRILELD